MREPSDILKCLAQKRQLTLQRLNTKDREEKAIQAYKSDCQAKLKEYDADEEKIVAAINTLRQMGEKYSDNFLMQVFGEGPLSPKPAAITMPPPEIQATIIANEGQPTLSGTVIDPTPNQAEPPEDQFHHGAPKWGQPINQGPRSAHKAGNHPRNPNRDRSVGHSPMRHKTEAAIFRLLGADWKNNIRTRHEFVLADFADIKHLRSPGTSSLLPDSLNHPIPIEVHVSEYYQAIHLCYHWGVFFLEVFSRLPRELALVIKLPEGFELTSRGRTAVYKRDLSHVTLLASLHADMIDINLDGIGRSKAKAVELAQGIVFSEGGMRKACKALGVEFRPEMLVQPVLNQ